MKLHALITVPATRRHATLHRVGSLVLLVAISACEPRPPTAAGPVSAPAAPAPPPAAATAVAETEVVEGVDLSNWQGGEVNFVQIKQAGKHFVFVKSSEGASVVDPDHARNVQQARAAGLAVGSYHFYESDDTPQAQFRNFSAQLRLQPGDLPPVVDIEQLSKGDTQALAPALKEFLGLLEQQVGVKPILYSGEHFANEYLSVFADYPLWLAEYNSSASPQLPKGWTRWTFWQHSQNGRVSGVPGPVDLNRFNGNTSQLQALTVR
ncbi:glycoside hydrolase family 25 protein [Hydrogenophaga luteola]|uniref:Glycoside hydrolase family 25 protein n=1 Tax=Hydrogenophaga luteola TaxID=1591122 RepID=A0ABV7W2V8_9BURK